MKHLYTICWILYLISGNTGFAQLSNIAAPPRQTAITDSLNAETGVQFFRDSLKINSWSESLKSTISQKFAADSLNYQSKIDSLKNLHLPFDRYTNKLDSITAKKDQLFNEMTGKKDQLLTQTKDRLEKWKSDVQAKLNARRLTDKVYNNKITNAASNVTNKVNGLSQNIPDMNANMPDVAGKLPGVDINMGDLNNKIPNLDANVPALNSDALSTDGLGGTDLPEMPQLSTPDLKGLDLSPDLSTVNKKLPLDGLDKLNGIQDKLGGASEQISALKNVSSNPDAAIESTLKNVDQFSAVQEQLGGVEAIKDNQFVEIAEKMKDPNAMKEEVKQIAVQKAINHFAGKEEVLQKAMDQLSKYKNKYESLNSLSDIKKLPKNAMKGKPFRERFLPGVCLQFMTNEDLLLDVNPYAGYRITGRLTSGLGWNQRIGYSLQENYFTSVSVIYGPRFYAEVKTWKGFIARAEFEFMNTEVPSSLTRVISDVNQREWVRTAFVGIKKDYRFLKYVRGTAFVMFSVYNDHRKSPYGDAVNSRFGFEFPLKRSSKSK